ncbi:MULTISPECIES: hypothetical protein [unclassified Lentimicrobium]|uniref:hypothetical protein n=1 Tax=unclassified Lentimicrobium TaxID=2677434 RepID=UPI0015581CE2|nr:MULTISPECIES: hypothetical protein [unclassified Lentimicrobium]NPD47690.1 hypothetical protein [Lentimicrobium sp. S6]NPD86120.1 hypothetical protein [Lentimicrobium sp. L6]
MTRKLLLMAMISLFAFTACDKDDVILDETVLVTEGNTVTVRNTYNDSHVPEISFSAYLDYAFYGSEVEFPEALAADLSSAAGPVINGLYAINFTANTIEFTLLPDSEDLFWKNNYRTLEEGVYDRYYFTFAENHNVGSFTCDNPAIHLRIDSENIIVVEVGEGFEFQPGAAFTIALGAEDAANAPIVQGDVITMRNTYNDAQVAEVSFSSYLDYAFGSNLGEDGLDLTRGVIIEGVSLGDDGLDLSADVNYSSVEFPDFLKIDLSGNGGMMVNGLYSIDINENSIDYVLLPDANDYFWSQNYRVLEEGVYDRYYFTFDEAHGVTSFSSTENAVNLRIDSDKILVVEIGEGFNFQPGAAFTIDLK